MEWTGLNELREKYLKFFESKDHLRLPSFPLVPQGDKSILLINAGMTPMKKYFTGEVTPPKNRVTTCQKCIRTPDIENVGKTARHGTYFEMLGNFSFGDYFKHEATAWAWEFITKELEIPVDKIYVSVFQDDDEAVEIWTKEVGVPADRIVRLGREDNFWEIGEGPGGPDTELYYDRGEKYDPQGLGEKLFFEDIENDRYIEVWNIVFSQYDCRPGELERSQYKELPQKNIDTGMGLERLVCLIQDGETNFDTDLFLPIIRATEKIAKYLLTF